MRLTTAHMPFSRALFMNCERQKMTFWSITWNTSIKLPKYWLNSSTKHHTFTDFIPVISKWLSLIFRDRVGGATRAVMFDWHLIRGGDSVLAAIIAAEHGDSFTIAKPSGSIMLELTVRVRVALWFENWYVFWRPKSGIKPSWHVHILNFCHTLNAAEHFAYFGMILVHQHKHVWFSLVFHVRCLVYENIPNICLVMHSPRS